MSGAGPSPPIQSMTGFAGLEGEVEGTHWQLDARSVNARSLDVRVRVPQGLERLEGELRQRVAKAFKRGTVSVSLSVRRGASASRYSVNQTQLAAYVDAIAELASSGSVAAPRADGLLALKGVIETESEEDLAALEEMVLEKTHDLVEALRADRASEGARIAPVLEEQLARIAHLREAIDAHPERALQAVKARLDAAIESLMGQAGVSEERLHQEAALLATRADVREELDRLDAHVAAARALLAAGGPVGRKLDFLAQEFNRETNTICSKAPHHAITQLGLELKAVVEQLREQVQNLE